MVGSVPHQVYTARCSIASVPLVPRCSLVRWVMMAETARLPMLAAIQPLGGSALALLYLTFMRFSQCVPGHLEATALNVYGTVGNGAPTALPITVSDQIHTHFSANGFGSSRYSAPSFLSHEISANPLDRDLRVY
jgi:hypothetical protein